MLTIGSSLRTKLTAKVPTKVALSKTKKVSKTSQKRSYTNWWADVKMGPPDPILGVTVAFNKDTNPKKLNLGVGAYRDDNGKPFILNCVRKAEQKISDAKVNHEYAGISGLPEFNKVAAELVFGKDAAVLKDGRVVTTQVLSGTGALRVAADFLARFLPGNKTVYLPNPTWGNHIPICEDAGLTVKSYRYYDSKTIGLDEKGMLEDVEAAPNGSIMLFHVCAHNPTGVDPTRDQWKRISQACAKKGHFVFFDLAYQGFASGDPEADVFPVRQFINDGHNVLVCQSFAKNLGLYGERIGALHIVTASAEEAARMDSQVKILVRPMYSNPPVYGARLVATILNDVELTSEWRTEVKVMADRIISMRAKLVQHLKEAGSTRDWSHITTQIGMFCYSGLTPQQVDLLASDYHIYMTRNGRISMAGLSSSNVKYLAESIHAVTSK